MDIPRNTEAGKQAAKAIDKYIKSKELKLID